MTTTTFNSLHITPYNENNLKLCLRYAEKFGAGPQNLLLWGNHGTGKTAAAEAIATHLIARQTSVVMTIFANLLETAHDAVFADEVNTADLLIIDDLKPAESTAGGLEVIYAILEYRTVNALPMILITALTPYQLRDVCADLFSRVLPGCYQMQFTGHDWRIPVRSSQNAADAV